MTSAPGMADLTLIFDYDDGIGESVSLTVRKTDLDNEEIISSIVAAMLRRLKSNRDVSPVPQEPVQSSNAVRPAQ